MLVRDLQIHRIPVLLGIRTKAETHAIDASAPVLAGCVHGESRNNISTNHIEPPDKRRSI